MTVYIPRENLFDKILHMLGKRRAIKIPEGARDLSNTYVQYMAGRELFISALLRPKNSPPPKGYVSPPPREKQSSRE